MDDDARAIHRDANHAALPHLHAAGTELAFRNLAVEAPAKRGGRAAGPTPILVSVSGLVEPGEMVFLLGPSGAGKSTLMDILADRMKLRVDGDIAVNGRPRDTKLWAATTKYVPQNDSLYASLTVEEAVTYAAKLYNVTLDQKEVVDETLKVLGLASVANVKTGGPFFRGISGGQKRRLSVATELVSRPSLVLLDEPTSGLDSSASFAMVDVLRQMAHRSGTSVFLSIHQPSKRMFECADKVIFLSKGRVAYFGPPTSVVHYFDNIGYELPMEANVSEWVIDLLSSQEDGKVDELLNKWIDSDEGQAVQRRIEDSFAETGLTADTIPAKSPAAWISRTRILTTRTFINMFRDPGIFWLRIAMYIFLAVVFGLGWWQIGKNDVDVEDQAGGFFFVNSFFSFMAVAAVPFYLDEKRQVIRERAAGAYGLSSFYIAHFIAEIPFVLLNAVINGTIVYWMEGLRPDAGRFFFFVLSTFLVLQWAESLIHLSVAINKFEILALGMSAMVNGMFMGVSGYLRPRNEIGWWLRWLDYSINAHFWNFNAMMYNDFSGRQLEDATDSVPVRPAISGDDYLESIGLIVSSNIYWIAPLAIIASSVLLRVMAWLWAEKFWTAKR